MQDDLQAIGGGGGRLFGGGGGDRRLRPQSQHPNHQALKCPRCDSLNTKFCYYNNYNLSQPRHFCKSCRRYWTKGGVLRNVPVGGGCRKNKRSKPKSGSSSDARKERKSNSHSSSESSSLTATTTATTTTTTTAAATAAEVASASSSTSALLNFQDSSFFIHPQSTAAAPGFDPTLIEQSSTAAAPGCGGGGIFPEIGSFTGLMTSSNGQQQQQQQQQQSLLGFSLADISSFRPMVLNQSNNQLWQHQQRIIRTAVEDDLKMPEMTAGFLDQSAQFELSGLQNRTSNGGLASLDWQSGGEQGLFDLTGTVDQAYWSQAQWSTDNDHSLNYLP